MGFGMGLNLLLLLAMVATNILSLYHILSSSLQSKPNSLPHPPVPDHLLHQLSTIRATINHLSTTTGKPSATVGKSSTFITGKPPSELLLYSQISPIPSSCHSQPHLLHRYMNYTPFSICPSDLPLAETLILSGCHPLPRRRCFSPTTPKPPQSPLPSHPFPSSLPDSALIWWPHYHHSCKSFSCLNKLNPNLGFNMSLESTKFHTFKSELDLTIPQLLQIAKSASSVLRLAIDVGAGSGTFAAQMRAHNVTVLSTTMNLGGLPLNEAVALRGLVALHAPLQQRLPVFDGVVDLVRLGKAVNRWIPVVPLEFMLWDVDRVLRRGGYAWIDGFWGKRDDVEKVFAPLIGRLGYRKVKWAIGSKSDSSGVKNKEVYLTALLQKPPTA